MAESTERAPRSTGNLTELLDEYMTAHDRGGTVDVDSLERRAGAQVAELRRHIDIVQSIESLSCMLGGAQDEDEEEEEGQLVGRFRTKRLLGRGGFSRVFLAHDSGLGRDVALKVLSSTGTEAGEDPTLVAEARALARLEHESVVRVFEVGEHEGQTYVAMEHVEGPSLRSVLRAMRSLAGAGRPMDEPEPEAAHLAAQALESTAARCRLVARIARALAYCHREGLVHRDVKPENILLDGDLTPRLIDFGLARRETEDALSVTHSLRGTPAYLAPEQVDRARTGSSPASDQFSLGIVLYELLTLENPFLRGSLATTMSAISSAAPPPPRRARPDLPLDVELVCLHCLERLPERRYPSAAQLGADLEAFLEHRAISLRPPSALRQFGLWVRRRKRQFWIAAAAAFVATSLIWTGGLLGTAAMRQGAFLAEIREDRRNLEGFEEPGEFRRLFERILHGRPRAHRYDRSLVGRLGSASILTELEELWQESIERLEQVLRAPSRSIRPSKRLEGFEGFLNDWAEVTSLAGNSGPPGAQDRQFFRLGTVELPGEGILERYDPNAVPSRPELRVEEGWRGRSMGGFYRYTLDHDDRFLETEFQVRAYEPRWSPPLNELDPKVREIVQPIAGGFIEVDEGERVPYDPFWISSSVVTWGDVRRVFESSELEVHEVIARGDRPEPFADGEPVVLPWVFAQEYAVRVGARLPTPIELRAATDLGKVEAPASLTGEWTSAVYSKDAQRRFALEYTAPGEIAEARDLDRWLESYNEESFASGTGFRVAISELR